jgi:SAM-dependent methyltransferase
MSEQKQRAHFNNISSQYEKHYGDACSQLYRLKIIYRPMFEGVGLTGMKVVEAMCGSGETTAYLLSRGAQVTGLDLAMKEIESFKQRWPDCRPICRSIFDSGLENRFYDCVVSVGGLHHLHPRLNEALFEIHRILKPGGYFCFSDPQKGSVPDLVRKFWYRHDHFFANNEAAIDLKAIKRMFAPYFVFRKEIYMGNIGYLFVLQSLILRVPLRIKALYTPALLSLESLINKIQCKPLSCYVVCQWQKK